MGTFTHHCGEVSLGLIPSCHPSFDRGADLEADAAPPTLRAMGADVLVGQARELSVLDEAAREAAAGHPRVVLVEGEAGIGKSTLLNRFTKRLAEASVLRASGDEAELLLPYGVLTQLRSSGQAIRARRSSSQRRAGSSDELDPLVIGAELIALLGRLQHRDRMVLLVVDDLHLADRLSASSLLFALRRLQSDRVMALLSARLGELGRLGEGWRRFVAGDGRVSRVRMGGLGPDELVTLSRAIGKGDLSPRAAARLFENTGGNPLYCVALLEELGPAGLDLRAGAPRIPKGISGLIAMRLHALPTPAQQLTASAAVLGLRCSLTVAVDLSQVGDPVSALEDALTGGLIAEDHGDSGAEIAFSHPAVHRAVYDSLRPSQRRRLHERAALLVGGDRALSHRVAAAVGPDAGLAGDLEAAARKDLEVGKAAQAAARLAQAAGASNTIQGRDRLLLDTLEVLVASGDVAGAELLVAEMASVAATARRSALLGNLDLFAGRTAAAETRLTEAWEMHDPGEEPLIGAAAALEMMQCCFFTGRIGEAVIWGERAVEAASSLSSLRNRAQSVLSQVYFIDGRGLEGVAKLDGLPASSSDVAIEDTDALIMFSVARVWGEDLDQAMSDLSACAARVRAGTPLRYGSQCLGYLADAEYRVGSWDDASIHAELAVSIAHDTDRVWDYAFAHSLAALVPAGRGDWDVAGAHAEAAHAAAAVVATGPAITAAALARANLNLARGDLEGVVRSIAGVRRTNRADIYGRPGCLDWRPLEIDALLGMGDLVAAEAAIIELEGSLVPTGPPSARVSAARLRGALATARGEPASAAAAFASAWKQAEGLRLPVSLARLELSEALYLRSAGQRDRAVSRIRSARDRFVMLGARPHVAAADRELQACGVPVQNDQAPSEPGLTPAEFAVARLVATGRSNREAAAELYVSVKTIEFHLRHVYAKLGIRSRRALVHRLGGVES
jgi:ATP/maltotriose-dependent transcriptional regulator MalT